MATTSLLIPTKAALTSIKYSPAELTNMRIIEAWFTQTGKPLRLAFLLALWEAYRLGQASLNHDFGDYDDALTARNFLTNADYGYTVVGPFQETLNPVAAATTNIVVTLT